MIIRHTTEKTQAGNAIVLMGANASCLERFEQVGDELIKLPMSAEELTAKYSSRAILTYYSETKGKLYYTQEGPTQHMKDHGEYVSCVHTCLMGEKKDKKRIFWAIWEKSALEDTSKTPFPVAKYDLAKDAPVLKIIQNTKFAF